MPLQVFRATVERNLDWHSQLAAILESAGHLSQGHYREPLQCRLQDSRLPLDGFYDLLITSPPYGDNQSTVPYGQSSYLPLQWIDLADIDKDVDTGFLSSTNEIDRRSLGGTKLLGDEMVLNEELLGRSLSLRRIAKGLANEPPDRRKRVLYFVRDLDLSLHQMVAALRVNAYLFMTVGNHRVGGLQVPLDEILSELLFGLNVVPVASASRRIP